MSDPYQDSIPAPDATPSVPQRPLPRNLPMLTEVVGASERVEPVMQADALPPPVPTGLADAEALLALLGPDLERRISEAIGRVLHEQMLGLNGRVQKAVAETVREAVALAHTRGAHAPDDGINP